MFPTFFIQHTQPTMNKAFKNSIKLCQSDTSMIMKINGLKIAQFIHTIN